MDCVDISQIVFNGYFGFCDFVSGKSRMILKMYFITNIRNVTQNINLIAFSIFSTSNGSLHTLHDSLVVYPIHFLEQTAVVLELEYRRPSQLSSMLQRMKARHYKLRIGDKINDSCFSSTGTIYIAKYSQNNHRAISSYDTQFACQNNLRHITKCK
jgi:hypothetical protein